MTELPSNFWQWLSSVNPSDRSDIVIVSIVFAACTLVLVPSIIAFTIYRIHRNRLNDSLKRELLDRGMTADDIVAIVRATPTKAGDRRDY